MKPLMTGIQKSLCQSLKKTSVTIISQLVSKQATSEIKLANLLNQRVIAEFSASEFFWI